MVDLKLEITKIMAHNKYRFPTSTNTTAVYLVDGSKCADLIIKLFEDELSKLVQEMVQGHR